MCYDIPHILQIYVDLYKHDLNFSLINHNCLFSRVSYCITWNSGKKCQRISKFPSKIYNFIKKKQLQIIFRYDGLNHSQKSRKDRKIHSLLFLVAPFKQRHTFSCLRMPLAFLPARAQKECACTIGLKVCSHTKPRCAFASPHHF